jgi:ABC-2 type transport system ATP-binding protein
MLKVHALSHTYAQHHAVDALNFEFDQPQIIALLGVNGAGKSTTLKMLSGTLKPTQGQIEIQGISLQNQPLTAKQHIGYLPEHPPLYPDMSVKDYLTFAGKIHGLTGQKLTQSLKYCLDACVLQAVKNQRIDQLSKGYQQRIGLAQAIIHRPSILLLDEPSVALDPVQLQAMRDLLQTLSKDCLIILSTHILAEAQALCEHVLMLQQGQLRLNAPTRSLQQHLGSRHLLLGLHQPPPLSTVAALSGVEEIQAIDAQHWRIRYQADNDPTEQLLQHAVNNHWGLYELTPEQVNLEQLFLPQE